MIREYDFIIVGGGSAGCTLALRLSEDADASVLLVERGPRYRAAILGVPLLGMKLARPFLRIHRSEPQAACNGRRLELPVARVMGGGSSVNAMIYTRGERRCYDAWAERGAAGWSFASVLPYFRRMEDFAEGGGALHGTGGPIGVSKTPSESELGRAFIDACAELGLPRNPDLSGAEPLGAGFYPFTLSDGVRSSAASGAFRRAMARSNLDVVAGTEVDRILFDGARATGIQCRRAGRAFSARAAREVIVAAGAVGSPKLLMLSGVGPADDLRALGIEPKLDLPEVGRNLQDHPRIPIVFLPEQPLTLPVHALIGSFARWCSRRDGVLAAPTIAAGAFARLIDESEIADTQYVVKWGKNEPASRGCIDFEACIVDVESRGEVRLRSADPRIDPAVSPNYLSVQREIDIGVAAIRFARALCETSALRRLGLAREVRPGREISSDRAIADYVKSNFETCFHLAGSCRMGNDEHSVVDPQLRVRGLEGLRVVDASVMPRLINGNTNGPTIMIAERAADLISRNDAAPEAERE